MKIALAQMFCGWGTLRENLDKMEAFSATAKKAGAAFIAFPELAVTGMYKDPKVFEISESLEGPSVKRLSGMAKKWGIAIGAGLSEKTRPKLYNTFVMIGADGHLLGAYRKNFIPKLEIPFWQGHHERPVFEISGKKIGVGICWDNCQPDLHAEYARRGVDVMLMPHAWDSDPIDRRGGTLSYDTMEQLMSLREKGALHGWRTHDEMKAQFYGYIPAASAKHRFYSLYINQTGQAHPCLRNVGPTFAVDKTGKVIAETKNDAEQIVYCELTQ